MDLRAAGPLSGGLLCDFPRWRCLLVYGLLPGIEPD